jgi:hypothetical protein
MKIVSGEWTTNGRTVYTKVTDTRSRHPGGQQAILSIAEGWSDRESEMFCQRIVAIPDMLAALEAEEQARQIEDQYDMTARLYPESERVEKWRDVLEARRHAEKLRTAALAAAKGADHATPTD